MRSIAAADATRRDFAHFSTKDRAMVDDASHGLMLWDGRSKGTLNNVVNLVRQRKPVVVYFAPTKSFHTVRTPADVGELLAKCDRATAARFERELGVMSASTTGCRPREIRQGSVDNRERHLDRLLRTRASRAGLPEFRPDWRGPERRAAPRV